MAPLVLLFEWDVAIFTKFFFNQSSDLKNENGNLCTKLISFVVLDYRVRYSFLSHDGGKHYIECNFFFKKKFNHQTDYLAFLEKMNLDEKILQVVLLNHLDMTSQCPLSLSLITRIVANFGDVAAVLGT